MQAREHAAEAEQQGQEGGGRSRADQVGQTKGNEIWPHTDVMIKVTIWESYLCEIFLVTQAMTNQIPKFLFSTNHRCEENEAAMADKRN